METATAAKKDHAIPRRIRLRKDASCCTCGKLIRAGEYAWKSSTPPWHWSNESGEWYSFAEHDVCSELSSAISDDEGVPAEPGAFRDAVIEYFIGTDYDKVIEWENNNPTENFGELSRHQWVEFLRSEQSDLDAFCFLNLNEISFDDLKALDAWLDFVYPMEALK